jgi:hypothetical protein
MMNIHIIRALADGYLVGDNYGNTAFMAFAEFEKLIPSWVP